MIVMMMIQDVVLHDFRDFVFDLGRRRKVSVRRGIFKKRLYRRRWEGEITSGQVEDFKRVYGLERSRAAGDGKLTSMSSSESC